MTTVSLTYVGAHPEVHVPEHGITAVRGVPVDVPEDVAGHGPGGWRPAAPAELTDPPSPWTVEGQWCRRVDGPDGTPTYEVSDPGVGLLAQVDVWVRTDGQEG